MYSSTDLKSVLAIASDSVESAVDLNRFPAVLEAGLRHQPNSRALIYGSILRGVKVSATQFGRSRASTGVGLGPFRSGELENVGQEEDEYMEHIIGKLLQDYEH